MPRSDKLPPALNDASFLVLPENRFAHEAISTLGDAVSSTDCEVRRPIYLFGPAGSGKSHLVRHGVRLFLQSNPEARTEVVTAAQFAAEFADAAENKTIPLFQAATRSYDLFAIEDLTALERRTQTQIQLLHMCDELSARGCQIIWTSRHSPGEMPGFTKKLVSRFRQGVLGQIRPPRLGSRVKLLRHLAICRQKSLPEDAAKLLASEMPVSPRELNAMLIQLEALSREQRRPIDSDLVRKLLEREVVPLQPTLEEVCTAVARHFNTTSAQLMSRKQTREVVFPRQIAMLTARALTGASLIKIGKFFGGRDHSTVLHSCRRLIKLLPDDVELRFNLSQLEAVFGTAEGTIPGAVSGTLSDEN